jgi:hypothetical protein
MFLPAHLNCRSEQGQSFLFLYVEGQFRDQKGLGPREIISLENGKLSGFPAKRK